MESVSGSRSARENGSVEVVGIGRRPLDYRGAEGWESRIFLKTFPAVVAGAGAGFLVGSYRGANLLKWTGTMTTNFVVVALCFSSAQELSREIRASKPHDVKDSIIGGLASGALLGRLQGGPSGALPAAIIFAAAGAGIQFGTNQLQQYRLNHHLANVSGKAETGDYVSVVPKQIQAELSRSASWNFPEWFPVQKLDEEKTAKRNLEKEREFRARVESLHNGGLSFKDK